MNTPTKTGPNVAGAAALPDVSELLAPTVDDANRLADLTPATPPP